MTTRIDARFAALKKEGRAAFVTFVMCGDPDLDTSLAIIKALPKAGADLIELGMPFTDPMADGPAVQAAGLRALKAGTTLKKTLGVVRDFRKDDNATPLVLMGYYNPIYIYGVEKFLADAKQAGVDGLIIVDLPPEEDDELCIPALRAGLNFVRLATPTTDDKRLPAVLANTSGFVYYVAITGITGAATADATKVAAAVARIKRHTKLPVCVGFGIKTPQNARDIASHADGSVVGSALVDALRASLDGEGRATAKTVSAVAELAASLAQGVRQAAIGRHPGRRAARRRNAAGTHARIRAAREARRRPSGGLLGGPGGVAGPGATHGRRSAPGHPGAVTVPVDAVGIGPAVLLAAGESAEVWLHNGTTKPAGPFALRCGPLERADGDGAGAGRSASSPRPSSRSPGVRAAP